MLTLLEELASMQIALHDEGGRVVVWRPD
jgi:hypothetical protein